MDRLMVCACASSIAGIFLIYLFSLGFEPNDVGINDVDAKMKGETVRVEGLVKSMRFHEDGHVFVTMSDGASDMQVTIFSDVAKDAPGLKVGDRIRITGYIDVYKGKPQIVPKMSRNVELL